VHVLTYRLNRKLDYWLLEGLAAYVAEQIPDDAVVRSAAESITYEQFSSTTAIQFANVGGYALAYTLISYLKRTYGWDQVMALAVPGATYETVLGLSKHKMFDAWRVHILEE